MKKIFRGKIFLIIILCMISCGIGVYGANTYNSNSVLYTTSDGESMSVNEALDDLYENGSCAILEEYIFDYTGSEQTFTVPTTGKYKLEVWGAQGGNATNTYTGGYGGYSVGEIKLEKGNILYINVGGVGKTGAYVAGGYNGGGASGNQLSTNGSGGGATHIATKSGILSTLSSSVDDILIVAGGGGGGGFYTEKYFGFGGSAGGYLGSSGTTSYYNASATGGNQNSCGTLPSGIYSGGFGKGGDTYIAGRDRIAGAGGGGFYGGASGDDYGAGGAGGSSYIGNSLLTNKSMYCYSCTTSDEIDTKTQSTTNAHNYPISKYAKKGNGFAKITYAGK